MHHLNLDRWSRASSYLHRRDARVKVLCLIFTLALVALTPDAAAPWLWLYAIVPLIGLASARVPLGRALAMAATILPFAGVFALAAWLSTGRLRALAMTQKSLISALLAVTLISTTPLPRLARAAMDLGAPRFLVLVIQFLHRYLFVISEQVQHMRLAAASRGAGGSRRYHLYRLRAAGGALGVLFARSYRRAEAIYQAMQARSFCGRFPLIDHPAVRRADILFLVLMVIVTLCIYRVLVLLS